MDALVEGSAPPPPEYTGRRSGPQNSPGSRLAPPSPALLLRPVASRFAPFFSPAVCGRVWSPVVGKQKGLNRG